jgi:hypothetical protein
MIQPNAPQQASKSDFTVNATCAHVALALRDLVDPGTTVNHPDDGPITITAFGRTIQVTIQDITDQA